MVVGANHPIQMTPPGHVAHLLQICRIMKEVGTHCKQSQTQADQLSQYQVCLFAAQLPVQQEQLNMYSTTQKEQSEKGVLTTCKHEHQRSCNALTMWPVVGAASTCPVHMRHMVCHLRNGMAYVVCCIS